MAPRYRPGPRRVKLRGTVRFRGGSRRARDGLESRLAIALGFASAERSRRRRPTAARRPSVSTPSFSTPATAGEDDGAHGPRGLVEKELVLDVGRRLASRLRERELRVVMTRDDDRFVPLEERFAIANDARGDLFISIHANATRDSERERGRDLLPRRRRQRRRSATGRVAREPGLRGLRRDPRNERSAARRFSAT